MRKETTVSEQRRDSSRHNRCGWRVFVVDCILFGASICSVGCATSAYPVGTTVAQPPVRRLPLKAQLYLGEIGPGPSVPLVQCSAMRNGLKTYFPEVADVFWKDVFQRSNLCPGISSPTFPIADDIALVLVPVRYNVSCGLSNELYSVEIRAGLYSKEGKLLFQRSVIGQAGTGIINTSGAPAIVSLRQAFGSIAAQLTNSEEVLAYASLQQQAAVSAVASAGESPEYTQTTEHRVRADAKETLVMQSRSVWTPDTRRCLWVLAVGVGQYKKPQVPPLPFARSDAERVKDWFLKLDVKGMARDNVHILCDEQATRENLLAQIDWLRRQALPEDAVFVYFAGHGAPELAPEGTSVDAKYLILYDTDPSQLFATGFPIDDLTRKLDTVKAKIQIVILEACYTGPVGQQILGKTPTADLEIRPRLIQQLGEKGGRVILSASSGRQIAIGSKEIKGGLFTHCLLNAWGDGSRRLLSERFDEATYQVRRASNQLGSLQEPAKFGDQNVDVILKVK